MDTITFFKNMYESPVFIRARSNFELLNHFQFACEKITSGSLTDNNFFDSLKYKRLFFLRREFRKLIIDKLKS